LFHIHTSLQHAGKPSENRLGMKSQRQIGGRKLFQVGEATKLEKKREKPSTSFEKDLHFLRNKTSFLQLHCFERDHLIGARMVYNKRNVTIIIAPPRVKVGLFQNSRFDLSVLLIGSTSSERGNSERLGFQLTYLSENFEKAFLPP